MVSRLVKLVLLFLISFHLLPLFAQDVASTSSSVVHEVSQLPTLIKPSEVIVGKPSSTSSSDIIKSTTGISLNSGTSNSATNSNEKNYVKKAIAPNKFQQLVSENTGKSLPIYGQNLFDNPNIYLLQGSGLASNDYKVVPGDEIRIQIWGGADYFATHVVDKNGQINLPKVGTASLAGIAVKDLENVLRKKFASVFTNFNLAVSMGQLSGITVYVVGHAQNPGTHQLTSLSSLINAIFASGGPTSNGTMRNIQLKRGNQVVSTIDLYSFIAKGDKSNDTTLQNGDVIYIPPVGAQVALMGEFDFSAIYELKSNENSLQDIFLLSGGLPKFVDVSKVLLERIDNSKIPPRQIIEIKLDKNGVATELKNGDVLTLLAMSQAFGNTVTLQGKVARPLRHRWFDGMRISDLIQEKEALITSDYYKRKNRLVQYIELDNTTAGGGITNRFRNLVEEINWDYAVVERLNTQTLRTDLLPFNLASAIANKDPKHNLLLQPGDVVTVLSQNDLRLANEKRSRLVRIEGEVNSPGLYVVEPGETLPQFISRTGGLTSQAYLYGAEFKRESIKQLQQKNLDDLVRKLENQYQSDLAAISQNIASASSENKSDSLIKIKQQALQNKINQIKAMQSQGRVALELNANKYLSGPGLTSADLPALPLEDGDHIYIPSTPSFINTVGSILNENVLVYRPGKTVNDVLDTAGLSEDADSANIFVLRADGSIVTKKSRGLFSSLSTLQLMPGDTVVVPTQWDRETSGNFLARTLKDWTQIFSNLGLGVASLITIKKL